MISACLAHHVVGRFEHTRIGDNDVAYGEEVRKVMSSKRFRNGAARLAIFAGIGFAAMIMAGPAQAAPAAPDVADFSGFSIAAPVLPGGLTIPGASDTTQLWPGGPRVGMTPGDSLWPGGPALPGLAVVNPQQSVSAPCTTPGTRACLQLSSNLAWLMDNGKVTFGPTPISHGRPGFETPPGVFHVASKEWYHWSTMHHAEMRYAVFFNGDIATHIGPIQEKSHGCIRMTPDGARAFYDYLRPGDQFEVVR